MTKYVNICGFIIFLIAAAAAIAAAGRTDAAGNGEAESSRKKDLWFAAALAVFTAAGFILRFYRLSSLPYGMQQDEASIGYEAWSLLNYGVDRFLNPWPVYPITYGSGGGSPLMIYLTMLPVRLFGRTVFAVRFLPALFGSLGIPLFGVLMKKARGTPAAIAAMLLLVLNPWHMVFSRWALDSNAVPFFELAMLALLFWGAAKKHTVLLAAGAFFGAILLYAYGTATVVVPVFFILAAVFLVRSGRVLVKQVVVCAAVFLVTALPLLVFYAVNYLGLPEFNTGVFSVQRFTASRNTFYTFDRSLPSKIGYNFIWLIRLAVTGVEKGELYSTFVPGYAQMFRFTFPLTFAGIWSAVRGKRKRSMADADSVLPAMMLILSGCIFVFSLFIEPNINRMILLLVPLVYFQAEGAAFIVGCVRSGQRSAKQGNTLTTALALAALLIWAAAATLFVHDYFGEDYAVSLEEYFMPGYGEAVQDAAAYAGELEKADPAGAAVPVISTYQRLSSPFMIALFYTGTPPEEFAGSARWRLAVEFYVADGFGRYSFGLPEGFDAEDDAEEKTVYILYKDEAAGLSEEEFVISRHGNYAAVYRK